MRTSRLWLTCLLLLAVVLVALWRFRLSHPHPSIQDLSVTSPLNQPGGGASPNEAYEVYSALYQAPADEPLAFAEDSGADIPQLDGNCLKPSTPAEREMAAAFESANRQAHRWEHKFNIPAGYQLLRAPQALAAQNCMQSHAQNQPQCAPWRDLKHVRILGIPGFDATHTHALVSVLKKCGAFCGTGGIFAVEKRNGTWQRSDPSAFTSECSWRY